MTESPKSVHVNVLLCSKSGKAVEGNTVITAKNIAEYEPAKETVELVSRYFSLAGFEVGPTVGISFAMSGSVALFEELFGVTLSVGEQAGVGVVRGDGSVGYELPLDCLAATIRPLIVAVAFEQPTDFGPGGFTDSTMV